MTVVVSREQDEQFTADEVLWADRRLVKALVRQAMIRQTEAVVDMIVDCQANMSDDLLTRNGLQAQLKDVPAMAEGFLNDVLCELLYSAKEELTAALYGAAVTGIKYDLAGDIQDIEVDITVS